MKESRRELIGKMMARAWESPEMATEALNKGKYHFAAINAYAAVFHAMKALLETREVSVSKPGRVIGEINRWFVKTGRLSPSTHRILDRLFSHRQTGYYSYMEEITEAEAKQDVEEGEKLLREFEALLKQLDDEDSEGSETSLDPGKV